MSPDSHATLSRRTFLGCTFGAMTLPSLGVLQANEPPALSQYTAPDLKFLMSEKEFLGQLPCPVAQRLDNPISTGRTAKIFVNSKGEYLVRPIDDLVKSGWIRQNHIERNKSFAFKPLPKAGDPDIRPSTGSGVFMRLDDGSERFFSNDHVLCAARQELEIHRTSDWAFDIAQINPLLLKRAPGDGAIPRADLTTGEITNATLTDISVHIYGVGGDLLSFQGKPFRIPFTIPSLGEDFGERSLFGLRLPEAFLHHPMEIAGMSGSPVLVARDHSVAGLVARVHHVSDRRSSATVIIFVGPDELRALAKRALESPS